MNPALIESILAAAVEVDSEAERRRFLDQACAGDAELQRRVEELIDNHFRAGGFLESPAAGLFPTADDPQTEQVGAFIGPYQLLEQIGEGGFGVVFMAEQQQPVHRKVAFKILKPGMDSKQVVARFEAERQALALMDHTNIAKVFDAGTTDTGRPYFVMELVYGVPITQFCDNHQLTPSQRLQLFVPVCQAIQHAHQKGIIHRDIKPSNVLVTLYDDKPVPKVIDFGVAKAIGQRLTEKTLFTQFGALVGTFEYMSPEQAEMNALGVDTRSDIYSLGVLLYELLTGSTPLERERVRQAALDEVLRLIKEEEPPRPSVRLSSSDTLPKIAAARKTEPARLSKLVRGELDWIVMRCLEKDRSRRYETASGLARDIERYLHDEPVEACPPSVGYRLGKFGRKYWVPVSIAAAFVSLLVAAVVASSWLAVRAKRAEGEAVQQRDLATEAEREATRKRQEAEASQYMADMGNLQAAWDNHNILRVRDLLAQTADFPERGFEWYYWQRMCRVEHLTLAGHKGGVTALAFAPDGRRLVTAVTDGAARVWETTTGRELLCLKGHCSEVTSVAYAPDSQWLVTGSTDGTARIWDAAQGQELRQLQFPNSAPVWAVAVRPDSKRVITGSEDGMARVWDAATGRILLTLRGDTASPVLCTSAAALLLSPQTQGPLLVASTLYSGKTGHTAPVRAIAVSGNGKWVVTGSDDRTAKIWNAADGSLRKTLFHGLPFAIGNVSAVAVTRDGKQVVTGSLDGRAKIWDMESGRVLRIVPWGHGDLLALALTPDGQQLLTGYWGGMANVRDMASGCEIMILNGHRHWVSCVAVSPDGQRLATGSLDGTARVWDRFSGRGTRTLQVHSVQFSRVAVTPGGQRLVARSQDGNFSTWDVASGRRLQSLQGQSDDIWRAAISPDGQRIVTAGDEEIAVWDAHSGAKLQSFKGRIEWVWSLTFTPDGQRIVIGSGDGTATVWDAESGRELLCLKGHIGPVSVAVSADGRRIVTGGEEGTLKVWDATRGHEISPPLKGHTSLVGSVAITPDGRRIVSGSWDGTARVWDGISGRELVKLRGHVEPGMSVAVTPDGRRLVTGNGDGTVAIWDSVSGRELLTLKGHTGPVRFVAVTSDGRRLISSSDDGTVKIWEAATPEQVALWTSQEEEAARQQAIWQRPVAGVPGFIQDWLVLAPLELAPGSLAESIKGLDREQILGEAKLQPRAGDRVEVGGREYTWQVLRDQEPVLDFNRFLGKMSHNSAGYAVCYVVSGAERNDLLLQVGCDYEGKLYLNGQQVYKNVRGGLISLDRRGPVTLHKGTNVLVLKVVTWKWKWEGCVRFLDREDKPAKGLRISLAPE